MASAADPRITDAGMREKVRWMLYAHPGWGKTSFIAEGARRGLKILLIHSPLDHMPARAVGSGLKTWEVSTWDEMMGGASVLDYLRYEGHNWDWVWFDCVSLLGEVLLDDIWAGTIAEKPSRAFLLSDNGERGAPNLTPSSGLDKGEYGRNMERMGQFFRHVTGMKEFHLGLTAHPWEGPHPLNPDNGLVFQPWIRGKNMIPQFCGMMNVISFLEVKEGSDENWHRLHFAESESMYCKDQTDSFLPKGYVDKPDLATITKKFEASLGKKSASRSAPARGRRGAATTTQSRGRRGARREQ